MKMITSVLTTFNLWYWQDTQVIATGLLGTWLLHICFFKWTLAKEIQSFPWNPKENHISITVGKSSQNVIYNLCVLWCFLHSSLILLQQTHCSFKKYLVKFDDLVMSWTVSSTFYHRICSSPNHPSPPVPHNVILFEKMVIG